LFEHSFVRRQKKKREGPSSRGRRPKQKEINYTAIKKINEGRETRERREKKIDGSNSKDKEKRPMGATITKTRGEGTQEKKRKKKRNHQEGGRERHSIQRKRQQRNEPPVDRRSKKKKKETHSRGKGECGEAVFSES